MTRNSQVYHGMGGHQSASPQTVEWLTGWPIIDALGGADSFDLDPATPPVQPWPTARKRFTRADNGLMQRWRGRVFLNPPYTDGEICKWLARQSEHGRGVAFIFARTETDMFFRYVWERAHGLLFLRGRATFHYPGGTDPNHCRFGGQHRWEMRPGDGRARKKQPVWCCLCGLAGHNAGAPSVLCAYGRQDLDVLAGCGLDGHLDVLRLPRGVLVLGVDGTWRDVVAGAFSGRRGPVAIADLYRAIASHPKARRNRHVRAKLRQQLQRGPYRRVGRGLWEAVAS